MARTLRPARASLLITIILLGVAALIEASDSFTVNNGATQAITAHATCRKVTNNHPSGLSVYVPTVTVAEWQSFRDHPPAGVTITSCGCTTPWGTTVAEGASVTAYQDPTSPTCIAETRTCTNGVLSGSYQYESCTDTCAGTYVGGYCWYLAANNQSCDTVCSTHSACNLAGTRNYAGSGGTAARCEDLIHTLGQSGSIWNVTSGHGAYNPNGCGYSTGNRRPMRFAIEPTTCAARNDAFMRACACNR